MSGWRRVCQRRSSPAALLWTVPARPSCLVRPVSAGREIGVLPEIVSKLCEEGRLTEAVEALGLLVQIDGHVSKSLLYAVLKRCAVQKDIALGRRVHAFAVKKGYQENAFLCNHILRLYACHGRLQDAMDVFTDVASPDAFMWSSIISAHVKHGQDKQAIELYRRMCRSSVTPDSHVFVAALQACARAQDLKAVQELHAHVLASKYERDLFVCNCLVDSYGKCGSLEGAKRVFDGLDQKDVVTWTAMIAGYSQHGMGEEALHLYSVMDEGGIAVPNAVTYVCLLQACACVGTPALERGRQLHAQIRERGHHADVFVGNSLVNMYAKCGSLQDAKRLFDGLGQKDVVTWTTLITGYGQQRMGHEALQLYSAMQEEGIAVPNSVTFVCLLQACASVGPLALEKGRQLHAQITEQGHEAEVLIANSLVNMYAKCGRLEEAQKVFEGLAEKDVVTWSAIIAGYSQQGMGEEALGLYRTMQEEGITAPNSVTFVCLLQACASVGNSALDKGQELHAQIRGQGLERDLLLANSIINMYAKCGSLEDAQKVFDGITPKNVLTWNAIMAGYSQQGMGNKALSLYRLMEEEGVTIPNSVSFVCLLQACASLGTEALGKGKQLHVQISEYGHQADLLVANSLVNMYAKCGSVEDARRVFDGLDEKNVVTWSAMISGYSQQGMGREALRLYDAMEQDGVVASDSVTFVCLLQACARIGTQALEKGKQLHARIREGGHAVDVFVANSLIDMYAKCGSLEGAQGVFDGLCKKDRVTWNTIIAGYSQQGMGQDALRLFSSMLEDERTVPDSVTFACVLQACASVGSQALERGKEIHAQIRERGQQSDVLVANSLVNMYAKCGSIKDAHKIFVELGQKDIVTWNTMIAGYSQQGMGREALCLFSSMEEDGMTVPDCVTFHSLLQACASVGTLALEKGKQLHKQVRERGHLEDQVVANGLVNMYAKCGSLEDSRRVFDGLCQKDVGTWNAIIGQYSQQGIGQEALRLYSAMQEESIAVPDAMTFVSLLQACASLGSTALEKGKQLHSQISEGGHHANVFVATSLMNMYAKCGSLKDAQIVFDGLGEKDVVTWNAMLAAYSRQGRDLEVLDLYSVMQEEGRSVPNALTFVCLLRACASVGIPALERGRELHVQIREQGLDAHVFVANNLVNMYSKCGNLEAAQEVFDGLGQKDVVTWNAMIAGYSQQGMGQEALRLYDDLVQDCTTAPDSVTFVCLLQACAVLGTPALEKGKQLHAHITEQGNEAAIFVANSLVNMYAKCGSLKDAQRLFDGFVAKDVVTWNVMIAAYAQQGMGEEALSLYSTMQGVTAPNSVTFVCLLQACANVAALHVGRQLHAQIKERSLQDEVCVAVSLINMYGKCGCMADAQQVFAGLPERDILAWNALVAGYSNQGNGAKVFDLVLRMRQDGVEPDGITFMSVLTVCSHTGLVDKGREYFEAMSTNHGITPTVEHYTCMVDLLGRAGRLDEALTLVSAMPALPDHTVWHTLLAACAKWINVEVGLHAFHQALELDKKDAAAYVMMSNIYAAAEMWERAREMQTRRIRIRASKPPGQSWWTDMDGLVHTFLVGEKKRPKNQARLKQDVSAVREVDISALETLRQRHG